MTPLLLYDPAEIGQSVTARLERQVARTPERLALVDAAQALTYIQLNRAANRLAHSILAAPFLPRAKDSAGGEPVAILIGQNAATVVAILGILKTGNFYVPLDLALTDARLAQILQDAGASLVVTDAANQARAHVLAANEIRVLDLDALPGAPPDTNPGLEISPDALLNLMYTSGTTGEPKGVMQTQRNVMHLVVSTDFPPHESDDRVAQLTSFSFGGSAAMLFRTLFFGAALLPFDLKKAGLPQLARFLDGNRVTRFHTVPSVLRSWLEMLPADKVFDSLRLVEVGGEPLFKRDLERLFRHLPRGCWVRNALGTTETYVATWDFLASTQELDGRVVPVGHPAPDMDALVLDGAGQPVPAGETGEIFIKSRYLSPGYWHKPELTRAAFLPDPAAPGVFLYKTGDLGRLRADGALEHLGRKDGMVKIRGHQVVLTFVESAVRALEGVRDAAVLAEPNAAGDAQLLAYIVPAGTVAPNVRALRDSLAESLPDFMIPSAFLFLDQLPRLPNGKLDRRSLPARGDARPHLDAPLVAPRTPLERELAQIWSQVLGIAGVGVQDAFVELGGSSLQAAQVVARASAATGVEIPLSAVFDVPTIEGLAQLITRRLAEHVADDELERILREAEALTVPRPAAPAD